MPRSFFLGMEPTLKQQIEHGIRLWHEAAEKRLITNFEAVFRQVAERMDFKNHRARVAAFKEHYIHTDQVLSPGTIVMIGTVDPEDLWGDSLDQRVVSETELKNNLINYEFNLPSAQNIEMLVVTGSLTPSGSTPGKPHPNDGFYISSHYFAEAKNLLDDGDENSAWISLTRAYYYLGLNSSQMTTTESSSIAAYEKHKTTDSLIALIAQIARSLASNITLKKIGIKAAARKIAQEIAQQHPELLVTYSQSHHGKKNTLRLRELELTLCNQIQKWAESSSVHPEIRQAILPFKSARGRKPSNREDLHD